MEMFRTWEQGASSFRVVGWGARQMTGWCTGGRFRRNTIESSDGSADWKRSDVPTRAWSARIDLSTTTQSSGEIRSFGTHVVDGAIASATTFAAVVLKDSGVVHIRMAFGNDGDDVVVLALLVFDDEHQGVIIVILSKVGGNF